jgi:PAS domain S-box-containing protein
MTQGTVQHLPPLLAAGVLDSLQQGVSVFDGQLRLVAWNRRFIELLRLPPALVDQGVAFADLARHLGARGDFGAGDIDHIVAARVEAARRWVRSYSERTTFDGRVLAAQTTPLPEGGFVTVYTELTERSSAEALTPERSEELERRVNQRTLELRTLNEALRTGEARLRLITDAVPAAIAYLDEERVYRFANRRYAELFGRQSALLIGRPLRQVMGRRILGEVQAPIERVFAGETPVFEHIHRRRGEARITRNTLVPELSPSGRVQGVVHLCLDVTEQKAAERAWHEPQKMSARGQLAGGLAHDFNNLLTVVCGSLRSLGERLSGPLVNDFVAPALRASGRGTELTRRLLAVARQQELEPCPVDVPALVAGTVQLLRRSLPDDIAVDVSAEEAGWPALVDPGQLENALVNLALNARDAMPGGGRLTIRTSHEPGKGQQHDRVRITVTDTGAGIPPELQARIFEPFFTTKPFGSGSGLGLSMVFGFVRQSGGELQLRSAPGQGTTFTLLLPRAEGAVTGVGAVSEPLADAPAVDGDGKLVLLVEDHQDVRQTVRRQLLELGYQVLEARDADDARSLLTSVPEVAALVSDVVMPGATNGVGLADAARRLVPGIKIVLITGYAGPALGGHDWFDERLVLRKPFGKEELARALEGAA